MNGVKKRKKKYTVIYILITFIIIGLALFYYYKSSLKPVSAEDNKDIHIEISSGSSSKEIAEMLESEKLIRNNWVFLLKLKQIDSAGTLKVGNYGLKKSMDTKEIIDVLVEGGKSGDVVKFTIPEGYEIDDISDKLKKEGVIEGDEFLKLASKKENFEDGFEFLKELDEDQSLEGFLFPSTYEIFASHDERVIIQRMLEGFQKIYKKNIEEKLNEIDFDLNEIITLASIVEREAKVDEERTAISGVFHNRLETGMNLGSCATVQYILGERKEVLTNAETRIDSPFNTYVNIGLPPAPIASPGEQSIIAALNPEETEFLYFTLTGEDGSHTFTKTYEEHLNAAPKK